MLANFHLFITSEIKLILIYQTNEKSVKFIKYYNQQKYSTLPLPVFTWHCYKYTQQIRDFSNKNECVKRWKVLIDVLVIMDFKSSSIIADGLIEDGLPF